MKELAHELMLKKMEQDLQYLGKTTELVTFNMLGDMLAQVKLSEEDKPKVIIKLRVFRGVVAGYDNYVKKIGEWIDQISHD